MFTNMEKLLKSILSPSDAIKRLNWLTNIKYNIHVVYMRSQQRLSDAKTYSRNMQRVNKLIKTVTDESHREKENN